MKSEGYSSTISTQNDIEPVSENKSDTNNDEVTEPAAGVNYYVNLRHNKDKGKKKKKFDIKALSKIRAAHSIHFRSPIPTRHSWGTIC